MRGDIVWENERYGAVYLVDRPSLLAYLASHVPVLHLGQADAVDAVTGRRPPWLGWWLTQRLDAPSGRPAVRPSAAACVATRWSPARWVIRRPT
jgi:hypothetical protein